MKAWARLLMALAVSCPPTTPASEAASQGSDCRQPSYDCAAVHVKRGDFDAAIRSLTVVLERAPRDVNALHLLGIALTGAGRIDEANRQYLAALRVDPTFYPAARNLGINEFNAGRLLDARRHFEQVLELAPNDPIAHLHLAEFYYSQQRPDAALPHYQKSGTLVSEHGPWLLHFAISLLQRGERQDPVALLEQLPRGDALSRFEAGMALGRAQAYKDAARFFASARTGYPDPYRAAYNQVLMLTRAEDFEEAIRVAEELLKGDTKTAELYHLVSRAYLDTGRVRQSIDALREAARLDPAREETYVDLALICLTHDDYDLGLEVIDIGLQHRPASSMLHLHRGVLQTMRGELNEAEQAFESARRLSPDSPAPYTALAMIWIETGKPAKAVERLRDIHRRFNDPVLSYAFALALIRTGIDPAEPAATEALDALRASIAAQPAFAPSQTELGKLLLKRGQTDKAIAALERAVSADPKNTAALYNLAQAYRKKGDASRARELLADLTKLNADAAAGDAEQDLKQLIFGVVKERK